MPSLGWTDVPEAARKAVEARTGPIHRVESASSGNNSALAARVTMKSGRSVFCKGAPTSARNLWMYRNEVRFNGYLAHVAPKLLWDMEVDDWLLLGFEAVPGRAADLRPCSADLPRLADFLSGAATLFTPASEVQAQHLSDRWHTSVWADVRDEHTTSWERKHAKTLAAWEQATPDAVAGNTLQHTDMTPNNFLVSDRVVLTDWSWPALAAPWVDTALLTHRLIASGHSPVAAERWAATVPQWAEAATEAVTSLAVTVFGIWRTRAVRRPAPYRHRLARAARRWVGYRIGVGG